MAHWMRRFLVGAALLVSLLRWAQARERRSEAFALDPEWSAVRMEIVALEGRLYRLSEEAGGSAPGAGEALPAEALAAAVERLQRRADGLGARLGTRPFRLLGEGRCRLNEVEPEDWAFSLRHHSARARDESLDLRARMESVAALVRMGAMEEADPAIVPSLLRLFRGEIADLDRRWILTALQGSRDPGLRSAALDALLYSQDTDTRRPAASALSAWREEPEVRSALVRAAEGDPVPRVRSEAARALDGARGGRERKEER